MDRGCTGRRTPPKCPDNSYPAVSPDGTQIAFVRAFGKIRNDQIAHVGIYRMRIDGSHVRRVTLPRTRAAEDGDPQWSPDGKRIVFVRHNFTTKPTEGQAVYVVNADGSGLRRITRFKLRAGDGPDWSPDGSQILFRSPEQKTSSTPTSGRSIPTARACGKSPMPARRRGSIRRPSRPTAAITVGMTGIDDQADVYRSASTAPDSHQ